MVFNPFFPNKVGNGDGGKSDGNGDKGGRGAMAMATKRVMVTAQQGWGTSDTISNEEGDGNGDEGVCVFLASGYGWVTVMHEIPISSAQPLTSLPYPWTQ
jgi:hypothetical protein